MAVLEKIRERGLLLLIVVGGALLAFILSEFINSRSSGNSNNNQITVGSVNGEEINQKEFSSYLDSIKSIPVFNEERLINTEEGYIKHAWESLVNEKLITASASDLGLAVTDEELKELETSTNLENISPFLKNYIETQHKQNKEYFDTLKNNYQEDHTLHENREDGCPFCFEFQIYRHVDTNGVFNAEKFENYLLTRSNWPPEEKQWFASLEKKIANERLSQKYQTLIEKGMYTTRKEAEKIHNSRSNAEVDYVAIPYSSIDKIDVSDEEIELYYNNNIALYQNAEETRNIEYVTFEIVPSEEDIVLFHKDESKIINESRKSLENSAVEQFTKAEINDPKNFLGDIDKLIKEREINVVKVDDGKVRVSKFTDSITKLECQASHIELKLGMNVKGESLETNDDLMTFAKELKQKIENGSDFGELAKIYSQHKTSSKGGDLEWFTEGKMPQFTDKNKLDFNDAYFSSDIGTLRIVTIPSESRVHLIKINNRRSIPLYNISSIEKEVKPSQNTEKDIFNKAKFLIKLAYDENLVQEDVKAKNKFLQYWWLLLDIGIIFGLLYFIYIKKQNIRRFVPYVVLLAILVTVVGIYFESESEEGSTILTSDDDFKSLSDSVVSENVQEGGMDLISMMDFEIDDLKTKGDREIIKWMFDVNTKVGDVSNKIYRCGNKFVVVSLSAINPKGNKTLESVRDIIEEDIQIDKKFDAISNQLSESPTLSEAEALKEAVRNTIGNVNFASNSVDGIRDNDVQNFVGAVNALDSGQSSRLIKGNTSAYVISVLSKASRTEYSLINDKTNRFSAVLKTLQENSDIVDNRSDFY